MKKSFFVYALGPLLVLYECMVHGTAYRYPTDLAASVCAIEQSAINARSYRNALSVCHYYPAVQTAVMMGYLLYARIYAKQLNAIPGALVYSIGLSFAYKHMLMKRAIPINSLSVTEACRLYGDTNACQRDPALMPVPNHRLKFMLEEATAIGTNLLNATDISGAKVLNNCSSNLTMYAQYMSLKSDPMMPLRIIFFGDGHGTVDALVRCFDHLKNKSIIDDSFVIQSDGIHNTHIIFGGDYVDRGAYGTETIALLLRLKIANPDRVHLVRGNHEDTVLGKSQSEGPTGSSQGFHAQLRALYGSSAAKRLLSQIGAWYGSMPVVLFADTPSGLVQFCHGGIEPGYNPSVLLDAKLSAQQTTVCQRLTHTAFCSRLKAFDTFTSDVYSCSPGSNTANSMAHIIRAGQHYNTLSLDDRRHSLISDIHTEDKAQLCVPMSIGFMWNCFKECVAYSDDYNSFSVDEAYHVWHHRQPGWSRVRKIFRAHQHGHGPEDIVSKPLAQQGLSILSWHPQVITHVTTPLYQYTPGPSYIEWRIASQRGAFDVQSHLEHHMYKDGAWTSAQYPNF